MQEFINQAIKHPLSVLDWMLKELELHPATGIGNPEQLKYELLGY